MGQLRRSPTRRTVLSAAAALGVGCALPWQRTDSRAPVVYLPAATPVRAARLRLVLAREGLAPLDGAVRQVVEQGARELGFTVEVQDDASFVGGGPAPRGAPDGNAVTQRLLVAVQAGTPPDGVLLLGRQAQTMRLQGMGLVQEVSALMRAARARHGAAPEAAERVHVLAGSWFAVPFYQRLVGHFVQPEAFAEAGLDPEREGASLIGIREALRRVARPAEGAWGWGIGPADTADVDAWCWSVIHG